MAEHTERSRDALSKQILVVEDDPNVLAVIVSLLRDNGLDVATAANGSDAIGWLHKHRPSMMILDLQLPGATGEVVLGELIALYYGAVPVITMTANTRSAAAMRTHGAWVHLHKPFALDELLAAVNEYL